MAKQNLALDGCKAIRQAKINEQRFLPGRGQPRISSLMQMLPSWNQERGLMRMYRATSGTGSMFSTGISFSLFPSKIWAAQTGGDGNITASNWLSLVFGNRNVKSPFRLMVIILIVHGDSPGHIPQQRQPEGTESEAEPGVATGDHGRSAGALLGEREEFGQLGKSGGEGAGTGLRDGARLDTRTEGQPVRRTHGQPDTRTEGHSDRGTHGHTDTRTLGHSDIRTHGHSDTRTLAGGIPGWPLSSLPCPALPCSSRCPEFRGSSAPSPGSSLLLRSAHPRERLFQEKSTWQAALSSQPAAKSTQSPPALIQFLRADHKLQKINFHKGIFHTPATPAEAPPHQHLLEEVFHPAKDVQKGQGMRGSTPTRLKSINLIPNTHRILRGTACLDSKGHFDSPKRFLVHQWGSLMAEKRTSGCSLRRSYRSVVPHLGCPMM
ncbi:hypothetical protein Nmel_010163 [Mimus melanotis]